ncbi:hypothetical protein [Streptomyces sp. NPDC005336]|uniref:hypothetical protein n=1 Tax=Streptomyces sp. NPDC005336 TaxID=3157035 RepID=UPI0033A6C5BD
MRIRKPHTAVLTGVVAAVGLLAVGCGSLEDWKADSSGDRHKTAKRGIARPEGDYRSTLTLSDGRKVAVRLVRGTGVQERHQDAGSTTWSAWRTLYKTDADLCQGVDLAEVNRTVSLIADFGPYCSDGEPPTESVAGVGTGELTDWGIDITKDFDGWENASINDDGSEVEFLYDSDAGPYSLRWEQGEGFGKIVTPEG